ncbi:hypothetical protein VOLCADRAFT_90249 [Volvox carteri f. nagariensis]|uniref:Uncharacterized protein n=1 Tax=Volvox carteri f. nagariensis TaxID=3068 RepID=D8TTV6_VOLCA|nr:uncharacterized protein VOLCADRAFT_90249 [Volvox carteri f. nagariensis]EFJ48930.1 hypothetical protein VOLCADRAFT_90249 [Volvox carteri f. nagariensis]|eukprot:XP_002949827.1 hypothetical protein VOLCADRAFT_90249 [Volvox carteri f. nagariensis]
MSLFPVLRNNPGDSPQQDRPISDNATEWLSNNASYQPHVVLEPRLPYGNYATQADFLRAAERYLESSSDSDAEDGAGATVPAVKLPGTAEPSGRGAGSDIVDMDSDRRAASGLAPRQAAAALTAAKPLLKDVATQPGEVFYDTRGDLDNLVYESLYGSNVASYYRADPLGLSKGARANRLLPGQVMTAAVAAARGRGRGPRRGGDEEEEDDEPPHGSLAAIRYFAAKTVAAERSRRLRRVFLSEAPVLPGAGGGGSRRGGGGAGRAGGGRRGWLLSQLEGPAAAAKAPSEGSAGGMMYLWLRFAAFQDGVSRLLSRRGVAEVAGSAAEKKMAILQRALDCHPSHPALLRGMMAAGEPLLEPEELMDRWERLLRRTPAEAALWRDYLTRRRSAFAVTKLSNMQAAYGNAMHALASERACQQRKAATHASERSAALAVVSDLDQELVRLVLELVDLELCAGASEFAVARIQALLEFHCFAPGSLDRAAAAMGGGGGGGGGVRLPAGALLRLFDNFWESGAPRVGEESAVGWAKWYRKENDALWVASKTGPLDDVSDGRRVRGGYGDQQRQDEDGEGGGGGGWTGWMELPPLPLAPPPPSGAAPAQGDDVAAAAGGDGGGGDGAEGEGGDEGEDEEADEAEEEGAVQELTEEQLLAQLGLKLDEQLEEMQRQGVPPDILSRWLRTERERSARDWQPLRPPPAAHGSRTSPQREAEAAEPGDGGGDDGAVVAQRVVLINEIRDGIFPIEDPDLKMDLILGCLCVLGVPLAVTPSPPGGGGGGAAAAVRLYSSCLGCCSQSFLRFLPQQVALAECQRCLPLGLAAAAAAAVSSGGGGGGAVAAPWYLQDESRRAFVARLLRGLLLDGPYMDQPQIALAYLLVEASSVQADGADGAAAARLLQQLPCADRAREAARKLLSERRHSVALLMALAAVEDAAGQPRAARRARDAALTGAPGLPPGEQRLLPLLAGRQVTREDVAAARRGFEARVPSLLAARDGALDAPSASCLYLGGAFEALTGRLYPAAGGGLAAALTIHKHATAAVTVEVRQASGFHEALVVSYCGLVVSELHGSAAAAAAGGGGGGAAARGGGGGVGEGGVQPAKARMAVLQLLALRLQLAHLGSAGGGGGAGGGSYSRLRRDLAILAAALRRRAEGSLEALAEAETERREAAERGGAARPLVPNNSAATAAAAAAVWWVQLAAEAAQQLPAGASNDPRVARLMERAAAARHLAPCAPIWTAYLAHEAAAGRLVHAKRVFLRAVREVPLSKVLWMLGLSLLGQSGGGGNGAEASATDGGGVSAAAAAAANAGMLTSREVSELLGVASDKGVRLHTDVYEVMLQHLAEQDP